MRPHARLETDSTACISTWITRHSGDDGVTKVVKIRPGIREYGWRTGAMPPRSLAIIMGIAESPSSLSSSSSHISGVPRRAGNEKFTIGKNRTMNKSERRVFGRWDTAVISRAGFIKRIVASRGRDSSLSLSLSDPRTFFRPFVLPSGERTFNPSYPLSYRCRGHDGTWIGDKKMNGAEPFSRFRAYSHWRANSEEPTNQIDLIVTQLVTKQKISILENYKYIT